MAPSDIGQDMDYLWDYFIATRLTMKFNPRLRAMVNMWDSLDQWLLSHLTAPESMRSTV